MFSYEKELLGGLTEDRGGRNLERVADTAWLRVPNKKAVYTGLID